MCIYACMDAYVYLWMHASRPDEFAQKDTDMITINPSLVTHKKTF
jgi:hypothetical protein